MARFKLIHLTPAARNAFRAYRDAERACAADSAALSTAEQMLSSIRRDIGWLTDHGHPVHPDYYARQQQREEAHQRIMARWQATYAAAGAAAQVALPLLEAEGYPFGWWHSGVMRVPAGVQSPGADRLARRR